MWYIYVKDAENHDVNGKLNKLIHAQMTIAE